jgi:hypothetical protein
MDLGDFILEVAATYDRADGLATPTQDLLRSAPRHLAEHVGDEIKIVGSGGKGMATYTPWVGFFDPDETSSPQYGSYVVYLFSEDLEHITLTLNQGMERLRKEYGDRTARSVLAAEAEAIRALLDPDALTGLDQSMHLGSRGQRQLAYEAGNIVSVTYQTGNLPPEAALRADLIRFMDLYRSAVLARQHTVDLTSDRGSSGTSDHTGGGLLADFRPKSAADYIAHLSGKVLTKSRKHERLVRDFGEHAATLGFKVATPHPRDLTLRRDGTEWLVEAKVIYRGNATDAVRSAIGQLLTYQHFHYPSTTQPRLLALFDGHVGDAYSELLDTLQMAAIWQTGHGWSGNVLGRESALLDNAPDPDPAQ